VTAWRKATRCGASNTCVQAVTAPGAVLVRDSADPHGPRLELSRAAFAALLEAIKEMP
jgi:hypothetical protein